MPVNALPNQVAIVVLNYRGAADTMACVASLKNLIASVPYHIIVVDNDSQDGSFDAITAAHPDIEVIASSTNLGFSGGNNVGIRHALSDLTVNWVWVLNNDTTVLPDTLSRLVAVSETHPNALIGANIRYPDGQAQRIGNRLNRFRGSIQLIFAQPKHYPNGIQPVEALNGCSMLIPRRVFDAIGFLPEAYFLYFEDTDYCLQAAKAGFSCLVALQAEVMHQEGASTRKRPAWVTYYYQRNRLILLRKTVMPWQWAFIWCYTRYRLFRSKMKSNQADGAAHYRAFALAVEDFTNGVIGPCPHDSI